MRLLIRRFITAEQRKRDDFGITEDDVMEIRQDISTLRFELIDIFNSNGMKTPNVNPDDKQCTDFIFKSYPINQSNTCNTFDSMLFFNVSFFSFSFASYN